LRNLDLTHDRCGRHFEAVLTFSIQCNGTTPSHGRFSFAPPTLVASNMQFLASISGLRRLFAFFLFFAAPFSRVLIRALDPRPFLGRRCVLSKFPGFSGFAGFQFSLPLLFVGQPLVFLGCLGQFFLFGLQSFLFAASSVDSLLLFMPLSIEFLLFLLRLFLQNIALDVGSLASNFHVDSA
jgi:hypothetical protein